LDVTTWASFKIVAGEAVADSVVLVGAGSCSEGVFPIDPAGPPAAHDEKTAIPATRNRPARETDNFILKRY
jgi:hypothetical protein